MSSRMSFVVGRLARWQLMVGTVALAVLPSIPTRGLADDAKSGGLGKLGSATGTLLRRARPDAEWKVVAKGEAVPEGELLLALPGVSAVVQSNTGAVRLTLFGNVPQISLTPALESAATLQRTSSGDLDVFLDRGRILVANTKVAGAANVTVRARKDIKWELVLTEPGAQAAIEFNARWAPGMPYKEQYEKDEDPKAEMVLLVIKGTVELKVGDENITLRAPPGPALYTWDSALGPARTPQPLEKLPPWAEPGAAMTEQARAVQDTLKPLIQSLATKPVKATLTGTLAAADAEARKNTADLMRQLAVTSFGATDDVEDLWKALDSGKNETQRLVAVEALRHWIGRRAGQDAALARLLVRTEKYTPEHASTVLQLLHSYGQKGIEDPITYEVLIADLDHDKLPIRELAAWHLYRLAPAGREIAYDAASSPEKRAESIKKWKQLVPRGQLPPTPKRK
jgi:hypothetical protein